MKLKLYHYWRSSSSWRVRMALAFKNITPGYAPVDLLTNEQSNPNHLARNPSGLVPCLEVTHDGKTIFLNESVAIIEWLDENFPDPKLLPTDSLDRATVRELVQIINADIQPVQNLRVLQYVSPDQAERAAWSRHWIEVGFTALEKRLTQTAGIYSFGNQVTMADLYLVPQCYNAGRCNVDLTPFPTIMRVNAALIKLLFCQETAPDRFQPTA